MSDPYRLRPVTLRIVVQRCDDQWNAWFEDRPELVFGGSTAAAAVLRLTGPEDGNEDGGKSESWRDRPSLL